MSQQTALESQALGTRDQRLETSPVWLNAVRGWATPQGLVMAVVAAVCVALVFYPMFFLVQASINTGNPLAHPVVQYGGSQYGEIFQHLDWLGNSLLVAITGTLLGVFLGTALAWIVGRTTVPGARAFEQLLVVPYYVTPLVGALAWSVLGSPRSGLINKAFMGLTGGDQPLFNINSAGGIIWVEALYEGTAAFLIVSAAMKSMDPQLEEMSAAIGGGKLQTLRRVTLPLMAPAVLGSALFVFASMMGSFSVAVILGFPARFYVVTTAIWQQLASFPPNYPLGAAMGISLFAFTAAAMWGYQRVLGSRSFATISGKAFRPRRINMGSWTPFLFAFCALYTLLAVLLPLGALVYVSFLKFPTTVLKDIHWTVKNYDTVLLSHAPTQTALWNSFVLAIATASLGVILMGLVSWIIYRSRMPGRGLLEYTAMFPQAVPRMVFSLGLLWAWIVLPGGLYGTLWILLACYLTVFLPLGVRTLSAVILQLDRSLEECARVCGAGWWRSLRTVTLPLLRPGVLACWVLIFVVSIREISASILLMSTKNKVIGPAILTSWESLGMQATAALAIVQSLVVLVTLLAFQRMVGKAVVE